MATQIMRLRRDNGDLQMMVRLPNHTCRPINRTDAETLWLEIVDCKGWRDLATLAESYKADYTYFKQIWDSRNSQVVIPYERHIR